MVLVNSPLWHWVMVAYLSLIIGSMGFCLFIKLINKFCVWYRMEESKVIPAIFEGASPHGF